MSARLHLQVDQLPIFTADGVFVAHYSANGLSGLDFPTKQSCSNTNDARVPANICAWHHLTTTAVKNILSGQTPIELPPLDLSRGTAFQLSVWKSLLQINLGRTQSYSDIAKAIGKPKAVRAVGGACGANPVPLLVPCHRVLAANRKIGGFSGGLGWKEKLLAREGVDVAG
jgi:O-6-methylguanine DNA methyltransferase